MMKRLAILILFSAASVFAQVGGPTAPAPNPMQVYTNQATNPGFESGCPGVLTGYSLVNANVSVVNTQAHSGSCSAQLAGFPGGTVTAFALSMVMHNHEAFIVRWWQMGAAGLLPGTQTQLDIFDNTHGDGAILGQVGRTSPSIVVGGYTWTQCYQEIWLNTLEHGQDSNIQVRFQLNTPHYWVKSTVYSLGTVIVDSNGYEETVTTPGTSGASAPTWNDSGTTPDGGTLVWTAGVKNPNVYIDDMEFEEESSALRTFVLNPTYHGYLYNDLAPPKRDTQIQAVGSTVPPAQWNFWGTGSATVAGEVTGVSQIDPPNGDTLSQLTLVIKMATSSSCSTGVLATDTFALPLSPQPWQFTPTQYGSLTVGEQVWWCSSLYLTSGMTLVQAYPPYTGYYENAAFRAGLMNWYGTDGTWYHNQVPTFLLGTYDRPSGTWRANTTAGQNTAADYITGVGGMGGQMLPQATLSPEKGPSFIVDYLNAGLNSDMDFTIGSSYALLSPPSDQLTPWLQAHSEFDMIHWQILNNWFSCLTTLTSTCSVPTFTPTITPGSSGSITANYLFVGAAGVSTPISQGETKLPGYTTMSTPVTVNLSSCVGSSDCSVTFTTPTCPNTRWMGWQLFTATGSTSTPPASSAFAQWFPSAVLAGQYSTGDYIGCGASVTMTVAGTGAAPPTTDTTKSTGERLGWMPSGDTDTQIWQLFNPIVTGTYRSAFGGFYIADEPAYSSAGVVWMERQTLLGESDAPMSGVIIYGNQIQYWRDFLDVIGTDPYCYTCIASPEEYAAAASVNRKELFYTTYNATALNATGDASPTRADEWTDEVGRETFGSRPTWNLGWLSGLTLQPELEQGWHIIITCQEWASGGCSYIPWQWGDSDGLEALYWNSGGPSPVAHFDTNNWWDAVTAINQFKSMSPVLLTPVLDSPYLSPETGTVTATTGAQLTSGQVISNVQVNNSSGGATTVGTLCNIQSGMTSIYSTAANFPYGPVAFATHAYALPTTNLVDDYILTYNACDAASNVTFSLPRVPSVTGVQSLFQGTTYTISTSGCPNSQPACFTVPMVSMGWYILKIPQQRGSSISGGPNVP